MTDPRNTARRPNLHWFMEDLRANGFVEHFEEYCMGDAILGLYLPPEFLRAWVKLIGGDLSEHGQREAKAIMAAHPPELTIRANDVERTLYGHYNESHVCPPDCS